jgi:hypothetical protein
MLKVATRFRYSGTPKGILKHAAAKARRRQSIKEIRDSLFASIEEPTPTSQDHYYPALDGAPRKVAAAVLIWDDGLDYNMDGTAYQDDAPGDHPHSYHHTRKDAEIMAMILEDGGCDPARITIVEGFWVAPWDTDRIPRGVNRPTSTPPDTLDFEAYKGNGPRVTVHRV